MGERVTMTDIIYVDGNIDKCRKNVERFKPEDTIVYSWNGNKYVDIDELYKVLEQEQQYEAMKDFNECQYMIQTRAGFNGRRKYYPMHIQLEQTSYCNAECIMCSHYYLNNQLSTHMQDEIYERIKHWLPYIRMIGLHGFGEPFLYPKLLDNLEQYKKYRIKFWANTNLSVIPAGLEKYWNDFTFLNISCDGATKEIFEGIRKKLDFDKFLNNVKLVREQAPGLKLVLAVVLMRQNIHQCEQFIELAARLGIKEVTFSKIGINYEIGNYEDSVDLYPSVLRYHLQKAKRRGIELGVKVIVPLSLSLLEENIVESDYRQECEKIEELPFWKYTPEIILKRNANKGKIFGIPVGEVVNERCFQCTDISVQGVCDWLTDNIYVSANGKVAFCCSNSKYYIGDLNKQSIDEIWNSENYKRMIAGFEQGKLPLYCRDCNLLFKGMLQYAKLI